MDRLISAPELATQLGTTLPRIHRAVRNGLIQPVPSSSRRLRFTADAIAVLRLRWGWTPIHVPGHMDGADRGAHTREEMLALAALSRRPLGLRSARAVARVAGISPTTASRVLAVLAEQGLVTHTSVRVVEGTVRDITIWTVLWRSPAWRRLAGIVGQIVLPTAPPTPSGNPVPARLWHLFWDTDPRALRLDRHGPYIIDRVLRANDLEALAWMTRTAEAGSLRRASKRRGLTVQQRHLATLIAESR
jgi:DNA-binding transcriptional ArsR family regulator